MTTINEVAKKAKVSVATVSRVLNNSSLVAEKTKNKVQAVIDKLGYEPNMLGRNLRRSEARIILVMLSNIANPFFSEIVHGINYVANKNDYGVLIYERDSAMKSDEESFTLLKQRLVDGIILLDPAMEPSVDLPKLQSIANKYPLVQCCEYYPEADIPYVVIDNIKASEEVIDYLVSKGRKKIGLVNYSEKLLFSRSRKIGYLNALNRHNLAYREEYIIESGLNIKNGERAANYFLSLDNKPDALFFVADLFAIGALKVFKERKVSVPDDIEIFGFDDIIFSKWCSPTLSTVSQPTFEIGCNSAEMIIKMIKTGSKVDNIVLDHEIIIRESTSR